MTEYYISGTPEVGDICVSFSVTAGSAPTTLAAMLHGGYKVTQVNLNTGRATARLVDGTGKAVQVVRRRFGWRLADGTGGRSVRFCREIWRTSDGTALFDDDLNGDIVNEPSFDAVPLAEPEEPELLWVAPYITYGQWHAVVTTPGDEGQTALCGHPIAADALVYDQVDYTGITCPICKSRPACPVCGEVHGRCAEPEPYTTAARKRDWVEIGRKAGEALARHEARLQRQADLLFELLGKLSYYAQKGGYIEYRDEYSDKPARIAVGELVREFRDRTDGSGEQWDESTPGVSNLVRDGRVRGYVEHRTNSVFWNITPASTDGSASFTAMNGIWPPSLAGAKTALVDRINYLDSICDGTRGIPGSHEGCSPELCKKTKEN